MSNVEKIEGLTALIALILMSTVVTGCVAAAAAGGAAAGYGVAKDAEDGKVIDD